MCVPYRVVAQCTAPGSGLPEDRPRYVMGIGYPLDILVCSGARNLWALFLFGCKGLLLDVQSLVTVAGHGLLGCMP